MTCETDSIFVGNNLSLKLLFNAQLSSKGELPSDIHIISSYTSFFGNTKNVTIKINPNGNDVISVTCVPTKVQHLHHDAIFTIYLGNNTTPAICNKVTSSGCRATSFNNDFVIPIYIPAPGDHLSDNFSHLTVTCITQPIPFRPTFRIQSSSSSSDDENDQQHKCTTHFKIILVK